MKNYLFSFLILFAVFVFPVSQGFAANSFGIAATVNKSAISDNDVSDRIQLIFATSGVRNSQENREKTFPQALNSLIEEQLQIQEAERQNLAVTEEEVLEGFAGMAKQNNLTAEQFDTVIAQQGIPKATLLQKIKAQIAWRNVITKVLRPQIDVTENDVNARLNRLKDNIGKTEYNVAEIFLPVTEASPDKETKELAQKLISELKSQRVEFQVVAAQFSKAPTGRQGGMMGWVQEGELPKELDIALQNLKVGQLSTPIRSLSGYYILALTGKREINAETLPSEEDVLNAIGLERLDRLQKRYLADIRSAAFIDRRNN
jgi:peptidyl-prolyl cis-trans isomerase SurA